MGTRNLAVSQSQLAMLLICHKIEKMQIKKLKKSCVIIDLATGGGNDFSYAKECGIKAIHALALPGKVAPVFAGNIMCDYVLSLLKSERGDEKI